MSRQQAFFRYSEWRFSLLAFLFCCCHLTLEAQSFPQKEVNISALELRLSEFPAKKMRIDLLFELSGHYLYNDTLKASRYARKILELSKKPIFPKGMGMAYHRFGDLSYQSGAHDLAVRQYHQAIAFYEKGNFRKGIADISVLLGQLYKDQGRLPLALEQALLALESYRAIRDTSGLISCNNTIGTYYQKQEEYSQAESHYRENLELLTMAGIPHQLAITFQNLGNLYARQGKYEEAIDFYRQAQPLYRGLKDLKGEARTFNNIGNVYFEAENYAEAIRFYQESLVLKKKLNNQMGIAYSYNNLGSVYDAQGEYVLAMRHYSKAAQIASELKAMGLLQSIWENMAYTSEKTGNYRNALFYTQKADSILTRLMEIEKMEALTEMEVKYETGKKEQENNMLRQNKVLQDKLVEQRTGERNTLLVVVVLILILVIGIFIAYRKYRKANQILEVQKAEIQEREAEKALLLRELHHRVKNNLQVISSLLSLQSFKLDDAEAIEAVQEGQRRVEAMSLIHKNLYLKEQLTHLNIEDYTQKLLDQVMQSYGYTKKDIKLTFISQPLLMEVDRAIPLGLILNELFSNVFKHAFKSTSNPTLLVSLEEVEGKLEVIVQDNGQGLPQEASRFETISFGMQLVKSLSRQLRSTVEIANEGGTRIRLLLPIKNPERKVEKHEKTPIN
jgi:two-component sensor histidine kinase/tetratricopeptide (TPR) repeat protein